MVMTALDLSVKDAKLHVASMHLVIASCWNDCLPKALAALSLSPSEFHSYLINEAQVSMQMHEALILLGILIFTTYYFASMHGLFAKDVDSCSLRRWVH